MDPTPDLDGEPFAMREDTWTTILPILSSLEEQQDTLFHDIDFDLPLLHIDSAYGPSKIQTPELTIPGLYEFNYGSLPSVEQIGDDSADTSFSSIGEQHENEQFESQTNDGIEEDIWKIAGGLGPSSHDVKYLTWEAFSHPKQPEELPLFLSEAGPSAFDAALQYHAEKSRGGIQAGRPVRTDACLRSLWQLSFGRTSLLFPYDEKKEQFCQAIDDCRISSYSFLSSQSVIAEFMTIGNATLELRNFVKATYTSRAMFPGLVTLANAIAMGLDAVESFLVTHETDVQSLLQLQAIVERPKQIVFAFKNVVSEAKYSKTDEEVLSSVLSVSLGQDNSSLGSRIMTCLLAKVSQPWLATLEDQIGLRQSNGAISVVEENLNAGTGEESFSTENEPITPEANRILSKADRDLVSASNRCLHFMQEHDPEHPICRSNVAIEAPKLTLEFDWADVARIESKAMQYQENLRLAIGSYETDGSKLHTEAKLPIDEEEAVGNNLELGAFRSLDDLSIASLNTFPSTAARHLPDEVFSTIINLLESRPEHILTDSSSTLPFPFISHLSLHPYLQAQHYLLTTASLRAIVLQHSIRSHLDLCHNFHMCFSGFFTSRLSSVLFDPSFETVERQRNTLRSGSDSMGLKLGSGQRRDWPPASSELRLALRGVLSEAWLASSSQATNEKLVNGNQDHPRPFEAIGANEVVLPGGLSFALRDDLKPEEIERVLEPHSVYALDFLRLSYTPPRALEAVFTPTSLNLYSRIFRLMLRMLRMNFVVGQIHRDTVVSRKGMKGIQRSNGREEILIDRFRHEIAYFINTLTTHFVYTGIGKSWTRFEEYIGHLERSISGENCNAEITNSDVSLAGLTRMHETTLRSIVTALFLGNRQRKVLINLETICDTILQFARMVREGAGDAGDAGRDMEKSGQLSKLYDQFKEQNSEFTASCISLGEKAEYGSQKNRERGAQDSALAVRDLVESLQYTG